MKSISGSTGIKCKLSFKKSVIFNRLKMPDMKQRHGQKCSGGNCEKENIGTKMQGWKLPETETVAQYCRGWKMRHKPLWSDTTLENFSVVFVLISCN